MPLLARIIWISRVSRGCFSSPLSVKDTLGNVGFTVVVVGCEGIGSDWEVLGCDLCGVPWTGWASMSAIIAT